VDFVDEGAKGLRIANVERHVVQTRAYRAERTKISTDLAFFFDLPVRLLDEGGADALPLRLQPPRQDVLDLGRRGESRDIRRLGRRRHRALPYDDEGGLVAL